VELHAYESKWMFPDSKQIKSTAPCYIFVCKSMISFILYIDPGSGSYLVQLIIAAVLGVAFFFRNIKLHIQAFFYRLFGKKDKKEPPESKSL